jgi:deoxyribose-phosphate aldolase
MKEAGVASDRNPGIPLDEGWVEDVRINRSAVERRAATLPKRRSIKKDAQAAWLLKAVACTDLTTLAGDDTPGKIHRLAAKARQPVRQDVINALGVDKVTVAALCVYSARVRDAVAALQGTDIPVASVATGFPAGQTPFEQRVGEIEQALEAGAAEIDIVISRELALRGEWGKLYAEIKAFREVCGPAHMKTILATGDLGTLENVGKASRVALMAGSDFIKTSTGKEKVNATLPVGLVMTRAIREYAERTGNIAGFKPAGGIRTAKEALAWLALIKEELGDDWLTPERFRIGASSLVEDIERQLSHHVTGRYAARHHIPMG